MQVKCPACELKFTPESVGADLQTIDCPACGEEVRYSAETNQAHIIIHPQNPIPQIEGRYPAMYQFVDGVTLHFPWHWDYFWHMVLAFVSPLIIAIICIPFADFIDSVTREMPDSLLEVMTIVLPLIYLWGLFHYMLNETRLHITPSDISVTEMSLYRRLRPDLRIAQGEIEQVYCKPRRGLRKNNCDLVAISQNGEHKALLSNIKRDTAHALEAHLVYQLNLPNQLLDEISIRGE